jgi:hypothetical protein
MRRPRGEEKVMRVVVAAAFVVGGMLAAVGALSQVGGLDRMPLAVGLVLGLLLLGLSVGAVVLFNARGTGPLALRTHDELVAQLRTDGLLVSTPIRARRAFGVGELDDEGPHYFLELDDGRVLYLGGQYLYDFEADDEHPRRFPCTEFVVHRHKTQGHVVELECGGTVLEPECVAPPFTTRSWRAIGAPEDGQVLADRPYDLLKELLAPTPPAGG